MKDKELSQVLRRFYGEINNKNGNPYSKSALIGIRAGLNRHLQGPPTNRAINIVTDKLFLPANKVFTGRLRILRAAGLDISSHKSIIPPGDIKKLYQSRVLSDDNPTSLQHKVFFEMSMHFGRRGCEGLASLKRLDIVFMKDDHDPNVEYTTINHNETTKKNHGVEHNQIEKNQRMYSQPNNPNCPVSSLRFYLSKLSQEEEYFFQTPRKPQREPFCQMETWYKRKMGKNTLNNMMKTISKLGNLTQEYTNHCIRATVCTVLAHNDVESSNIIKVTGHKDVKSLAPYISSTSNQKRKEMSQILFDYGKENVKMPSKYILKHHQHDFLNRGKTSKNV